jgi:hypothetical protein
MISNTDQPLASLTRIESSSHHTKHQNEAWFIVYRDCCGSELRTRIHPACAKRSLDAQSVQRASSPSSASLPTSHSAFTTPLWKFHVWNSWIPESHIYGVLSSLIRSSRPQSTTNDISTWIEYSCRLQTGEDYTSHIPDRAG